MRQLFQRLKAMEETMNCLRCNSLMFSEQYDDLLDSPSQAFKAKHCPRCGDIVDTLILHHRQHRIEPRSRQARLEEIVPI